MAVFAGLSAARAFPYLITWSDWTKGDVDLAVMRAILTAVVQGVYAATGVSDAAARAVTYPANAAARAANAAAAGAARAAALAADSALATAIEQDDTGHAPAFRLGLWAGAAPPVEWLTGVETWRATRSDRTVWGFWLDWYIGIRA